MNLLYRITEQVAKLDRFAALMTRLGLIVATLWIGGLKVTHYDAEGIVPVGSNSPFLRWLLETPHGAEHHRTAEGAFDATSVSWHHANGSYQMSLMLGVMIVAIGVLIALGFHCPAAGVIGGILFTGMGLVILSFSIATAEVWLRAPGAAAHGFPFLPALGRFAVEGAIMIGASVGCAADSAKQFVVKRAGPVEDSTLICYWGR